MESGGPQAPIVVIPTASSIPDQVWENYREAFQKLGCKNVKVADIRERSQAESQEYIDMVRNAKCVMFSGGNQSEITQKIQRLQLSLE